MKFRNPAIEKAQRQTGEANWKALTGQGSPASAGSDWRDEWAELIKSAENLERIGNIYNRGQARELRKRAKELKNQNAKDETRHE